ncbi:MAG TPA: response regulator [Sphingobacteriaceae bacterium]|nr:response regulator [Sphingobacteriaceae bacterium]
MKKRNLKILILEDNESDADLLQRELRKSGLNFTSEIVQARDTFEIALDTFKPDIILSDYSLPSFDGVSAFRIKQSIYPDIPFIIVSGIIGEESAVELIKNGVTDYVLKDKLFALTPKIHRALKETEEKMIKRISDEELKIQNKKLREIAFLQSHQVRVPVAQILGLFSLFEFDNPSAPINSEILSKLKIAAESLDKTIHDIVSKTNDITNAMK